jgi:hypothetical protein
MCPREAREATRQNRSERAARSARDLARALRRTMKTPAAKSEQKVFLISGSDAGYVDAKVCQTCHAGMYKTYSRRGMGRSFYPLRPAKSVEGLERDECFFVHPDCVEVEGRETTRAARSRVLPVNEAIRPVRLSSTCVAAACRRATKSPKIQALACCVLMGTEGIAGNRKSEPRSQGPAQDPCTPLMTRKEQG